MPAFIPALELSRRFYHEAVRPILAATFPQLPYAAARLGPGSDVLGFDTAMSTDHGWAPAVTVFLRDAEAALADPIRAAMQQHLPRVFYGYPVEPLDAAGQGVAGLADPPVDGVVHHRVVPVTLRAFVRGHLAYDLDGAPDAADWLTFPAQTLRELTAGAVFYDAVGDLTALRQRLAYYPQAVWLYLLAAGWTRIGQEEHLMPRAGTVGDELGSALIGSRLVRDVMHLCFLMERQYPPYAKWFGTAFRQLHCAAELEPFLWRAQTAEHWQDRTQALAEAYEHLARMHNALGITEHVAEQVSAFHDRPFTVLHAGRFADAIVRQIDDRDLQRIATRPLIGSIDQFSDSTDLRGDGAYRQILRGLYL